MDSISIVAADGLTPSDALAIVKRLTHDDSEFQREIAAILDGDGSSATPIALCHSRGCLVGWACSHLWREQQTLEMFVDPLHRKRGIATALAAFLRSAGVIDPAARLAVFSAHTSRIAARLGFGDVWRYESSGDDWLPVEP